MLEFATDIEAAKHYISMNLVDSAPGQKMTLTLEIGDPVVGNRGTESVMGLGEALAQLRNEAGLTPGQVSISRDSEKVTIQTSMESWNQLRDYVNPQKTSQHRR